MSRLRELTERQAALQLRCAVQRGRLGHEVAGIEQGLASVDRAALAGKRILRNPLVIALGVGALAAIGPKRILRFASRFAVAASVAGRAIGMLRR